jgi:hypothetical protein
LARVGIYLAIALLVLLYVGLTAPLPGTSTATDAAAEQQGAAAAASQSPIRRPAIAAAAVGLWIVLDLVISSQLSGRDRLTVLLVRVLIGWGALLALGALLSPGNQRLAAALIVFGVTAAFVGFWIAALAVRKDRSRAETTSDEAA